MKLRQKTIILSLFLMAFVLEGIAGDDNPKTRDYSVADSIALNCAKKYSTTSGLTYALIKNLGTDEEKFRALFRWVTHNVAYNLAARKATPKDVMKRKKAVCQGYSELLREMCLHASLKCEVVSGYAKSDAAEIGELNEKTSHAWNAIRLGAKWYLVDATWAAGHVYKRKFTRDFNEYYYLTDPDEFMYRHYPDNPDWFLTDTPISKKEFEKLPIQSQNYFRLGTKDMDAPKGKLKNKLKYEFTTTSKVYSVELKFEKEKEFTTIEFTEENGVYAFVADLKGHADGIMYLYFNNEYVLMFYRK